MRPMVWPPSMRDLISGLRVRPLGCSRNSSGVRRQTMHQQCLGPPGAENSASKSGQVAFVAGLKVRSSGEVILGLAQCCKDGGGIEARIKPHGLGERGLIGSEEG